MSSRITKKDVERSFEFFCELHGFTVGTEPGNYYLERNSIYGWMIVRMSEDNTQQTPFGVRSRSTTEMYNCLRFAIDVKRFGESSNEKG